MKNIRNKILTKLMATKLHLARLTLDVIYPKDPNSENWRTIEGAHVHLSNGKIDGGAGGKFKGNTWTGKQKHQFVGPKIPAQMSGAPKESWKKPQWPKIKPAPANISTPEDKKNPPAIDPTKPVTNVSIIAQYIKQIKNDEDNPIEEPEFTDNVLKMYHSYLGENVPAKEAHELWLSTIYKHMDFSPITNSELKAITSKITALKKKYAHLGNAHISATSPTETLQGTPTPKQDGYITGTTPDGKKYAEASSNAHIQVDPDTQNIFKKKDEEDLKKLDKSEKQLMQFKKLPIKWQKSLLRYTQGSAMINDFLRTGYCGEQSP